MINKNYSFLSYIFFIPLAEDRKQNAWSHIPDAGVTNLKLGRIDGPANTGISLFVEQAESLAIGLIMGCGRY